MTITMSALTTIESATHDTSPAPSQGINNAVYRSGFATTQEAYARAQSDLWAAMERAESVLSASRFLCGDRITEADLRLYPTLVRFDAVYATLFKCARHRIATRYPNLLRLMRDLYHLHLRRAAIRACLQGMESWQGRGRVGFTVDKYCHLSVVLGLHVLDKVDDSV